MNSFFLWLVLLQATWFQDQPLYKESMAHPRSPQSSLSVNYGSLQKQELVFFRGSLGKNIPIVTIRDPNRNMALQLGVQGGAWMDLGYERGAFPLLTQDFLIAIPLSFQYNNWAFQFKYSHLSAHLGDSIYKLKDPIKYSRDFLTLGSSFEINKEDFDYRAYLQGSFIHKMTPRLPPWSIDIGMEFRIKYDYLPAFFAHNLTWNQDVDSLDYSAQAGVLLWKYWKDEKVFFKPRIALTFSPLASDRRGQFFDQRTTEFGISFIVE